MTRPQQSYAARLNAKLGYKSEKFVYNRCSKLSFPGNYISLVKLYMSFCWIDINLKEIPTPSPWPFNQVLNW